MKKLSINKTYLIYFIVIFTFVLLRIASSLGAFSFIKDQTILSIVSSVIIQILILFLLPFVLIKIFTKNKTKTIFKEYKFQKLSPKCIMYSFLLGILTCILNFFVAFIFSAILSMFGYEGLRSLVSSSYTYDTLLKFVVGVVCVAVLPALCEEFLHRGFVLNEAKNHIGYKRALIISSVLFGLMHLNVNQVFYAIVLGFIMGYVAIATNNIWPAVIMHFTNNFINVYLEFAANKGLPFGNLSNYIYTIFTQSFGLGFLISTLTICLVVLGIVYLIALLFRETRYREIEKDFQLLSLDFSEVDAQNPITPEEAKVGFDIYFKERFKGINSVVDIMIPRGEADNIKISLLNKIFLIGSLLLGILITIFTFIWGVL